MSALVLLLLLAAGLTWWGARRAGDSADYFAAGHKAGAWLVGVAGTAAAVSGFTFVGGPGLFAAVGVGSLWIILSAPLTGALQCWAVGEPVAELVERHGAVTIPELLSARFGGSAVKGLAAVVVAVGCVALLAVQARAAAVLGEDFLHVPGVLAAVAAMVATTAYTAAGGMRAGLVADAVQGALMAGFAVLLAVAALVAAGGPGAALATLERAAASVLPRRRGRGRGTCSSASAPVRSRTTSRNSSSCGRARSCAPCLPCSPARSRRPWRSGSGSASREARWRRAARWRWTDPTTWRPGR
jgi:Na+/proline symporter